MTSFDFPDRPLKISVVMACLNAEKTIGRTLESIKNQNYPHLELIIADGLSSDRTLEIIEGYKPFVSILIREKDGGVAEALNKGFRRATGEVFCYINADDSFTPGALLCVAETFRSHPEIDVVTGGCQRVYEDGVTSMTKVPKDFQRLLPMIYKMEQSATFWRASAHRAAGELDESYSLAFDWEWFNRLNKNKARFLAVDHVLSIYYFSDNNLTSKAGRKIIRENYRITKHYGPFWGYLADVYLFLFRFFDMKEYYDQPLDQLPLCKRLWFGMTLRFLYAVFGREAINAYNWNWASKQIRGKVWYK